MKSLCYDCLSQTVLWNVWAIIIACAVIRSFWRFTSTKYFVPRSRRHTEGNNHFSHFPRRCTVGRYFDADIILYIIRHVHTYTGRHRHYVSKVLKRFCLSRRFFSKVLSIFSRIVNTLNTSCVWYEFDL